MVTGVVIDEPPRLPAQPAAPAVLAVPVIAGSAPLWPAMPAPDEPDTGSAPLLAAVGRSASQVPIPRLPRARSL